jgi:hypothetical protein
MFNMKKTIVVLMVAAAATVQSSYAFKTGDTQLWLAFSASGKLDNGVKLSISEDLRNGDDMGTYYYSETALSASYGVTKWLSVAAGFVEAYERKDKTLYDADGNVKKEFYFRQEHRPRVEVKASTKLAGWGLEDRVRVEYRMKDDTQDYFRYRNRIKVKSPFKWTPAKINPYVAWEAFLEDLPDDVNWELNRHRFYAGVGLKITEHIKGDLYYLKQLDWKSSDWREYNVVGISLGASF